MDLTTFLIQAVAGAICANAAGNTSNAIDLGPIGNTLAGLVGGGIGGQILTAVLGLGGAAAGMDLATVVSAFVTGGVSGAVTAIALGLIRSRLATR